MNTRMVLLGSAVVATITAGAYFGLVTKGGHAAAESDEPAAPKVFTPASAMLAIYGAYDGEHEATLLPREYTPTWEIGKAETKVSPLLVDTFLEAGQEKGVIVAQRQMILDGSVVDSHATASTISVYVFKHDGEQWHFEKGKKEVTEIGAHGEAPAGTLTRIGENKFGILFLGGDIHQGYTEDYAVLVGISEAKPAVIAAMQTGASNSGACSDEQPDAAEKSDVEDGFSRQSCWGYESNVDFLKCPTDDYYVMRWTREGTDEGADAKKTEYYEMAANGEYRQSSKKFDGCVAVPAKDVNVGAMQGINMATIPRRLLGQGKVTER